MNVFIFLIFSVFVGKAITTKISLHYDGYYENVLIAIDDSIDDNPQLLNRIEKEFTAASRVLKEATRAKNRTGLIFGTIDIIVPKRWSNKTGRYQKATWQSFSNADIRIAPPNPAFANRPNTKQPGGCGDMGMYTHYTKDYFLDENESRRLFGDYAKIIVHEWAHYRWGVFDEYPSGSYPHFYVKNTKLYPSRCSKAVDGYVMNRNTGGKCKIDSKTNKVEDACTFYPSSSSGRAKASLMYLSYIDSIVSFCDSNVEESRQHNVDAPNKHNDMCNKASVWSVIRNSPDFKQKVIVGNDFVEPIFRYFQRTDRTVVLVLDESTSMGRPNNKPIQKLKQAATTFIWDILESTAKLGVVRFSNGARLLKGLKQMSTNNIKKEYSDAIKILTPTGSTDMGDGLIEGFKTLGGDVNHPEKYNDNGYLLFITDGEEYRSSVRKYSYKKAVSIITRSSVTIDVISIGSYADTRLSDLAKETGGLYLYADPSSYSSDLMEAMLDSLSGRVPKSQEIVLVNSGSLDLSGAPQRLATIDSSIGRNTTFTFTFENAIRDLQIISPKNKTYDSRDGATIYVKDVEMKTLTVRIPGTADAGEWKQWTPITYTTSFAVNHNAYMVTSKPLSNTTSTITTEGLLSSSVVPNATSTSRVYAYIQILDAGKPVLNATVNLTVTKPDNTRFFVIMRDDGAGSDSEENDAIYSASVVGADLTTTGFYNLKAEATFFNTSSGYASRTSESIKRIINIGGIRVDKLGNIAKDVLAPDIIRNLRATIVSKSAQTVRISWRAVGDNGDRGKADKYDVRILTDPLKPKSVVTLKTKPTLPKPGEPGRMENAVINFKSSKPSADTYYISVQAIDKASNAAEYSQALGVSFSTPSFAVANRSSGGMSGGAIAAVVIFLILVICGVACGIFFGIKKGVIKV